MEGEATRPALAELVEQGATAEGDDRNSVAAAAMLAIDLAGDALPIDKARCVALCFDDDGDVQVHVVEDGAAERVRAALQGDGVTAATVAAADVAKAFAEAAEVEGELHDQNRASMPPAPMQ